LGISHRLGILTGLVSHHVIIIIVTTP